MPAKWQTWMPFYIDRWRGSPDVQAMHPAARAGYLYLLASAWQTDDCSLSADPLDLATEAGFTDELWTVHGPRILRKFQFREDGRLHNAILLAEWNEAKRIFESRQEAARRTTKERSSNKKSTVTVKKGDGDRHTKTETVTETNTLFEDSTNPLAPSGEPPEPPAGTLPLNDKTDFVVSRKFVNELQELYPAVDVMQEMRHMKGWCIGNPRQLKTRQGIKSFITKWLKRAQDNAPARGNGGSNGNGHHASKSSQIRSGAMASLALLDAQSQAAESGDTGRTIQAR